ncbi:MAG: hypothetical protein IIX44_02555 [Clostridia bacterium]|nr:hypothetical protein [Clostridia bacterium]
MKKLSIILVIIMLVGLFASCEGIGDSSLEGKEKNKIFEFSYEIENTEYLRGEEIRINAYVKNISGRTQKYTGCSGNDYIPVPELYWLTDDGEVGGELIYEPLVFPCDVKEKKIKRNAIGCQTYVFVIPDDAVCGAYSLKLSRGEDSRVFEDVLRITDISSQNENEKYQYSPVTVSSGGASVNPIRVGTSCQIQYADGTFALGCDGLGVWRYLGERDTDLSTFPLLILEDEPQLTLPENTRLEGIRVYDLNAEEIGGYYSSLGHLATFPAGEYVVVIKAVYDTSAFSQTEYEISYYDDFFRLSIPSKGAAARKYDYSSTTISSGGFEISPIKCLLWSESHTKDGALSADGVGVSQIIKDKEDHYNFPTLFYNVNLQVYPPVNVNLYTAKVKVYDTDYNELKYSFEKIEDIRYLLPGEYLIVFREVVDGRGCDPDITEYTISCYECIFKFIVPENSIKRFSFENDSKTYKAGEPGVISQGFKNTSESPVRNSTEAAERAKNECTIGYDAVTVLYDGWDNMWSVTFYTRGTLGGCQTVYLDSKGITRLIVYGE